MGIFSGIGRLFRKGASTAGSLFKKGAQGIASIARKGFYEAVDQAPRLLTQAGSVAGSALGDAAAIAIGQPELAGEFGYLGGKAGGALGRIAGDDIRSEIKKPVSRGGTNRLGSNPSTFTPMILEPKPVIGRGRFLNEIEKKKRDEKKTSQMNFK